MIIKPQKGDLWSRDEMILVFNLYFKLRYGQLDHRNPMVKELANIMGRSDNSVAMRLSNFASCDPMLQQRNISGLSAHKNKCQPYWDEFFNNRENLIYESEKILAKYQDLTICEKFGKELSDIPVNIVGENKLRLVKTRVNQFFFRQLVLANYDEKCALTGIDVKEFLVASHIIPWAENVSERLNPQNGICLSALYDKAFDRGFITFSDNGNVMFSKDLLKNSSKEYFVKYFEPIENKSLSIPQKYYPKLEFLQWHRKNVFKG